MLSKGAICFKRKRLITARMAVASPGTQLPLESAVRSVLVMTRSGSEEDNQNKILFYLNSYYYHRAARQ